MKWMAFETMHIPLMVSGLFYAVLCVFSIVTGVIYMSGRKELNPLELPDKFVEKLSDADKRRRFARQMGLVTLLVGVVQGVTAWSILNGGTPARYGIALGFTLFSICSVLWKLKGKINVFPALKLLAYAAILVVLLLGSTRALFF